MAAHSGHYAREQIKQRRKEFRNMWPLLVLATAPVAIVAALMLEFLFPRVDVPLWVMGPVALAAALWATRSQLEGTYQLESSIEAEGWTSHDLKVALGGGWHVVDGISFGDHGDVDHVVVGPGGVYAIETKYSDSSRIRLQMAHEWAAQADDNARRIGLLLKHNYGHDVAVTPAIVMSGSRAMRLPREANGIPIVRRRHLRSHTSSWHNGSPVLSPHEMESIRAALLDYRGIRQDYESGRAT